MDFIYSNTYLHVWQNLKLEGIKPESNFVVGNTLPIENTGVTQMFSNESLSKINKGIIVPMKYSHKIYFTIKDTIFNLI